MFYISYEMGAHRLTNLIHATFWYSGALSAPRIPRVCCGRPTRLTACCCRAAVDGTIEEPTPVPVVELTPGVRLRGLLRASLSAHRHGPLARSWCTTHIDLARDRGDAITVGTVDSMSHWFRGSATMRRAVSTCPDPDCCHRPNVEARDRWERSTWPSARDHSGFVSRPAHRHGRLQPLPRSRSRPPAFTRSLTVRSKETTKRQPPAALPQAVAHDRSLTVGEHDRESVEARVAAPRRRSRAA